MSSSRRPIVVKESEKCATLIMNNIKQRVVLKKNLQALDKACDRTCNHITMSQRLTYKRFKQKLARAKITYSKIIQDKEMERELRKKQMTFTYNTNYGQDPEDEEVLSKIWNSHSNQQRKLKSAPAGQRPETAVTIAQPTLPQRPDTVGHGVLPNIEGTGKGKYITTGLQVPVVDIESADEDNEEKDTDRNRRETRFMENSPAESMQKRRNLQSAPASTKTTGRNAPNIFEEDTRPTLLDIQKERVKAANYESKVKQLCDSMKPFKVESERVIQDYYLVVVKTRSKEGLSSYQRRVSEVTEEDIKKATGKPDVPSMTMKRLNWDFNRPNEPDPAPLNAQMVRGRQMSMIPAAAW